MVIWVIWSWQVNSHRTKINQETIHSGRSKYKVLAMEQMFRTRNSIIDKRQRVMTPTSNSNYLTSRKQLSLKCSTREVQARLGCVRAPIRMSRSTASSTINLKHSKSLSLPRKPKTHQHRPTSHSISMKISKQELKPISIRPRQR